MNLSTAGYGQIARRMQAWADELCQGRVAYMLEGGYDLAALSESVVATLDAMRGVAGSDHLGLGPTSRSSARVRAILDEARRLHGL